MLGVKFSIERRSESLVWSTQTTSGPPDQPSKPKAPAAQTNVIPQVEQIEQCDCEEEFVSEIIDDVFDGVESG